MAIVSDRAVSGCCCGGVSMSSTPSSPFFFSADGRCAVAELGAHGRFRPGGSTFLRPARMLSSNRAGNSAAKSGRKGEAFAGAMSIKPGVWVYQLTDEGLALELTAKGTKYYKDSDLN